MDSLRKNKILVIGSTNTDMVVRTDRLPRPGETVLGGIFMMNPGGKGANQAVAAARLGADVTFVCKTGNDMFGADTRRRLADEGIDTTFVYTDEDHPSGVALIAVDSKAENSIVVASGANAALLPPDIERATAALDACEWVLMQLETPMETIEFAASEAVHRGGRVILNPAPAAVLSPLLLANIYLLTPNETEAQAISGIGIDSLETAEQAARKIIGMGVQNVVVTLGAQGALICDGQTSTFVEAHRVAAVDTTAAGDVFNAGVATALAEGLDLEGAVRFAAKAAALSVTRAGAQASAPFRNEVDAFRL